MTFYCGHSCPVGRQCVPLLCCMLTLGSMLTLRNLISWFLCVVGVNAPDTLVCSTKTEEKQLHRLMFLHLRYRTVPNAGFEPQLSYIYFVLSEKTPAVLVSLLFTLRKVCLRNICPKINTPSRKTTAAASHRPVQTRRRKVARSSRTPYSVQVPFSS